MNGSRATPWAQIAAFARRDTRVQLSYHFQLTMRYVSTGFGVAVFFFIGKLVGDAEELQQFDGGYFSFALIGLVVLAFALIAMRDVSRPFTAEGSSGTLEILLASSTPLWTILTGSLMVPFALGAVDLSVYLVVGGLLGGVAYPFVGVLFAVPIFILTVSTFVALGIFATAFLVLTRRGEPFTLLGMQATNLLAGTVFPVAVLPDSLQFLAHLVPAFYGLRALRSVLLAGEGFQAISFDFLILVGFNLVLLPASMWALRRALRMARTYGTLVSP